MKKALISNITEYGRMTHAEMTAVCDAARLGISINGATIYVTTYPCHNCAKHLIASGVKRIVFVEPYPKSRALASHKDAISIDKNTPNKVILEHFIGISPRRYRDIFEKSKRKDSEGVIREWYLGYPAPRIVDAFTSYIVVEGALLKSIFPNLDSADID